MTKFLGLCIFALTYFSIFNWLDVANSHRGVLGLTLLISSLSVVALIVWSVVSELWRRIFPAWGTRYSGSAGAGIFGIYIILLIAVVVISPIMSLIFEAPTIIYYIASSIVMLASVIFVFVVE